MYFERITVWLGVTVDQDHMHASFPLGLSVQAAY